ncbi:hypothetical protein [Cloacibacillus porcorum]|nr:hypothetical protein [Cloacibacillus sp.]
MVMPDLPFSFALPDIDKVFPPSLLLRPISISFIVVKELGPVISRRPPFLTKNVFLFEVIAPSLLILKEPPFTLINILSKLSAVESSLPFKSRTTSFWSKVKPSIIPVILSCNVMEPPALIAVFNSSKFLTSVAIAGAAISISAASITKNIFIRFNIMIILPYSGEKLKSETGPIRAR